MLSACGTLEGLGDPYIFIRLNSGTPGDDSLESLFQGGPRQHYEPVAAKASNLDIRADSNDLPFVASTWVDLLETDRVSQP